MRNGTVVFGQLPFCPCFSGLVLGPLPLSSLLNLRLMASELTHPLPGTTAASISASSLSMPICLFLDTSPDWCWTCAKAAAWVATSSEVMIEYPPVRSRFSRS